MFSRKTRADPIDGNALEAVAAGVGGDLPALPLPFVPEDSMRRGAKPDVDLVPVCDALGFVEKAPAGVLHGVLDFTRGGGR